ncbi:putative late blight resistance protein homolog R1B-8 [Solanum tuberosum]|uniref:putative late blight resistance protein homolog R1B-8 n=1 Tax=Solanum tuberosum TaxID=4113 RepID=UPI00073A1C02|nr:PREDICTED: putative late blight resistance protein homolog R1B-8 [Solanum tuberosum]
MKSVEEVIKVYVDNLISSSLVIAFNEIGDTPTCQLHDLVHEFCLIKAREEKLFDQISSSTPSFCSDLMPRQITIHYNSGLLGINNFVLFDSNKKRHSDESILIAEDTKLEKLKILGQLILSYSKDTEVIFKRFPNLQLPQFELKESWDYSTEQYWFPKLDCLTELEDLNVGFESSNTNDSGSSAAINRPWNFYFPLNLKKLRLVDFPLTSNSLSTIARLSNLEELYLGHTIIHGEEWNMGEEDTFENLKYLKLHEMTLSKWEVGEESFPSLEKLKLQGCHELEEIPPIFGDISSLKIIKLVESPQLEDSAMKIKEYAEDMRGGDELQSRWLEEYPVI